MTVRISLAITSLALVSLTACSKTGTSSLRQQVDRDETVGADGSGTQREDAGFSSFLDAALIDSGDVDASAVRVGSEPYSCGAPEQGLMPVDCTAFGDESAGCVFSNHCACTESDGYKCEGSHDNSGPECEPGVVCVVKREDVPQNRVGSLPTSCGDPAFRSRKSIDCTRYGDLDAVCVFGDHCMCSVDKGFECQQTFSDDIVRECEPGAYCVPKS
ncbi:MAG: hypothetical protein VYC39_20035 [Myxococcota bacterium]|nr:hypothetical protein [Myxococcota bacterium]